MMNNFISIENLSEQCRKCEHLKVFSVFMDNTGIYSCGKHQLIDRNKKCNCFSIEGMKYDENS